MCIRSRCQFVSGAVLHRQNMEVYVHKGFTKCRQGGTLAKEFANSMSRCTNCRGVVGQKLFFSTESTIRARHIPPPPLERPMLYSPCTLSISHILNLIIFRSNKIDHRQAVDPFSDTCPPNRASEPRLNSVCRNEGRGAGWLCSYSLIQHSVYYNALL